MSISFLTTCAYVGIVVYMEKFVLTIATVVVSELNHLLRGICL